MGGLKQIENQNEIENKTLNPECKLDHLKIFK
jgi:hypothetical protein